MDFIRNSDWIEKIAFVNLIALFLLVDFGGGISKFTPLTYTIDVLWLIVWGVTAAPAVYAAVYGLTNKGAYHFDAQARSRRIAVSTILLVVNVLVFALIIAPNPWFDVRIVDMNSLFR